jgi:uncharacterized protein YbaA (DUF1428 family)
MSTYVDGFVLNVKKERLTAYKQMAKMGCKIWKKYGALDYKECIIDDAAPEHVSFTFPKMAKTKEDEVIVFAYIVYKSKADRNRINKLVMKDPTMNDPKYVSMPMPFDMKRFSSAGFKTIVE